MAQPEGATVMTSTILTPRKSAPSAFHRFLREPLGVISAVILVLIVVVALIVPVLGLQDPNFVDLRATSQPPSGDHLLGTDSSGRDILSRLLWGARINLAGAALALIVAVVIGLPAGLLAGFYGKRVDSFLSWFNEINMALPGVVVVLAVRAVVGPSIWVAMAVFGIMLAPAIYRLVRAAVISVRRELYIDAARVAGLSDARILGRHVLTVVRAPIIIQSARLAAIGIAIQAGLEFLGVSDNTVPSWGQMLNEGFRRMALNPLLVLWPALAIGIVTMTLILLGNALRDALESRGRARRLPAASVRERAGAPAPQAVTDGALLSIRDLHVSYSTDQGITEVVHGVTLDVVPGEVLGLVGESGSGKSQTSFAVLGLLPEGGYVSGGAIAFDGTEIVDLPGSRRERLRGVDIGYIPQEPMSNLDPSFTIGYQLITPLRRRLKMSKRAAVAEAMRLLGLVGLPDPEKIFRSYAHEISGGQAQRVLIAGAVSLRPRLLIADEPTTALDVTVQAEVLDLLRDLQKELRMSVVLVTHNFGVVADLCDRVCVMQAGRIVETGAVEQVLGDPAHEYTQRLLASMLDDGPTRPNPFARTVQTGETA
jgi:ABC-type dipeptide/oligopeptide/nickel transport system ATPase component/ABC-type dipeptide/oligopeptide/nickel transport system permease subunit